MAGVKVDIDISGYVEQVSQARSKDIPFATAKALTRVAQDAQIEVRRDVQRLFHLRNTWTQQGIRITPAQKLSWPIQSEVYTATANEKTGAPDYLIRQDDGGEKVPFAGGHIAIPTKYLRAVAPNAIPDPLRPRNLLPIGAKLNEAYKGRFDGPSTGPAFQRLAGRRLDALGSREFIAFLKYDRAGTLCIFVRRRGSRDVEPWYVLVTSGRVRPVLEMAETVAKVVTERFEQHWDDAWDAIENS